MGQALYRKYRSKKLSEIVGQEHITETLAKALRLGRISHAYLFTGPRGVGKTSIARILAHEINELPYTDDSTHMDIIEIDAASNRRIDEIRELREKVHVAPTTAKYKVYIIDEVHMLTKEAFNALLKTLEEPPAHVVFILATTDAHKLPETIVSRTQRYSFKPVETPKVVAHLRTIADEEKIKIDDAALTLLAEHGEGSFRDSISMLDQASSHNDKLTITDVQHLLGIPSAEAAENLLNMIAEAGPSAVIMTQLVKLYDQGYQPAAIAKQLAGLLRQQLILNTLILSSDSALQLLVKLLEVPIAYDSARYLEICLLQALPASATLTKPVFPKSTSEALLGTPSQKQVAAPKIEAKKEALNKLPENFETGSAEPLQEEAKDLPSEIAGLTKTMQVAEPNADDEETWQQILAALKAKHNTLYGLVRMARPDFTKAGELCLTFAFDFHRKRLTDPQNQRKLRAVIKQVTGQSLKLECLLNKDIVIESAQIIAGPSKQASESLASISNIFGGGELIE